jgi:hypothetical protein
MIRALVLLALLLGGSTVHAAVAFVEQSTCNDFTSAGGDATCAATKPTGTADGHMLVACVFGSRLNGSGTPVLVEPSGWTVVAEAPSAGGGTSRTLGVYYKIAASEGASYTWSSQNASADNYVGVSIITLSGTETALDVSYDSATHLLHSSNTINQDQPDITTASANAWAVACQGMSHTEITAFGAPSGLTLRSSTVDNSYRNVGIATIDAGAAGAESIGVWTSTGTATNTDSSAITIAVGAADATTCPATCTVGTRTTGVCITDVASANSGTGDQDNILYYTSGTIAAGDDTICYDATSDTLSDAVSIDSSGWITFVSGGDIRTDQTTWSVMDAGGAAGAAGTYQVTQTPTLTAGTTTDVADTTATLNVTLDQVEGTVYACVQALSVATPSHAQVAAGTNGAGAACAFADSDASPSAAQQWSAANAGGGSPNASGLTAGTSYEACFAQANAATSPQTATVVCSDAFTTVAVGDTTPAAFEVTDLQGASFSTTYISDVVTVADVSAATNVNVIVDGCDYSTAAVGTTSWTVPTDASGAVQLGDHVRLHMVSSSESLDTMLCYVSIGGVSDWWGITTAAELASCDAVQDSISDSISGAIAECQ